MVDSPKTARKGGTPKLALAPAGGKALARLLQMMSERGILPPVTEGGMAPATKTGGFDIAAHLDAFGKIKFQLAPPVPVAEGWRCLGPFVIPHGQTYGSGGNNRPAVAGRVSALAVDPLNASHILAGSAQGGVWESKDAGLTWAPRTDAQPSLSTGAIAFDPIAPSTVYAGTGEGDFFSYTGAGLLRSIDGGQTWAVLAGAPFLGAGFYSIAVDANNTQCLLAGCTSGLYQSVNGGAAWTQQSVQRTWRVAIRPPQAGVPTITEAFAARADGLFRSTDGGATWVAVALPGAPAGYTRIDVAYAPSSPAVVIVAAAGSNGTAYLWRRSVNGGAFAAETVPADLATGQAWYDWFLGVAPNNPSVVYWGAINVHKGTRAANGVWTWTNISARPAGDSIHPDQHCIAFSPTNANGVLIGNDGGVYASPDGGATWKALNKGLCITEFEYIAQHPAYDCFIIGGTQDNGTQRFEGNPAWFHVKDGDGGDCGIDDSNPYTCFASYYGWNVQRSTTGGAWGSWTGLALNPGASGSLFYPPIEVRNKVVAIGGAAVISISVDGGTTFTGVNLPAGATCSAMAIASDTRLFACTTAGSVYRVDSVNGAWQAPVALTSPGGGYISDIALDPGNANRLWVTYSSGAGRVFRSDNTGGAWVNVGGALPTIACNTVVVDPANSNTVYVGFDIGVYRSTNAGGQWVPYSQNLPNAQVKELAFHGATRQLRAATRSRGVWEISVDTATTPPVKLYVRDSVVDTGGPRSPSGVPNPFVPGAMAYWWQSPDIKIDVSPYQTSNIADVDWLFFEDDHGVAAAGLIDEQPQRGKEARVYFQIHNRGLKAATNVKVRAFFAEASAGLPNLPANFWVNFPNNVLPAGSPWQAVGPALTIPSLDAFQAKVAGQVWQVPQTLDSHTCMFIAVIADNDPLPPNMPLAIDGAMSHPRCALRNLAVINPPAGVAPFQYAMHLNLWGAKPNDTAFIHIEDSGTGAIQGVMLSALATKSMRVKPWLPIPLTGESADGVTRFLASRPKLAGTMNTKGIYKPTRGRIAIPIPVSHERPEPIIVVANTKFRPGQVNIVQRDGTGKVVGGFTLNVLPGNK